MIDYSQLDLIWPPIAILLIGLVAGWFLQRHVLVRQMEDLETQHLDILRAAEDEMHAARDEARLQGQKLDEAQMAITLGHERLTLLDRRLKEAEDRLLTAPAPQAAIAAPSENQDEVTELRRQLAEQQVFAERLNQLEQELIAAKAETMAPPVPAPVIVMTGEDEARALREREATIQSLRNEVASIETLRLRLSEMVAELGLAHSQVAQLTRERNELAEQVRTAGAPVETSNELVRKLAEAIARRQEVELALGEANQRLITAQAVAAAAPPPAPPKTMAAAAGAGAGYGYSAAPPLYDPPPSFAPAQREPLREEEYVAPVVPLLSPAQLAGGLSQLLFENRIHFAPERSDILPDSKLLLEDIADLILSSEPVRLVVEGHTERGDARASFYLSERRAVAVMERLVKLGVPEHRMMSVGYGDTRPIDENTSAEGRMRNRRVEIRILGRT